MMRVFAKSMGVNKPIDTIEVAHDLGIEIHHNGSKYTLSVDNYGDLNLRSIEGVQLIIKPKGSNTVEIRSE